MSSDLSKFAPITIETGSTESHESPVERVADWGGRASSLRNGGNQ